MYQRSRRGLPVLLIAWFAFSPRSAGGLESPSPAGHWIGDIPLGDGQAPKLVFDLDRVGSRWVGEFDVADFGIEDYPVLVEVSDRTVKLRFSATEADFVGTLSTSGVLTGTIDFSGKQLAVEFERTGASELSESFLEFEAAADDPSKVQKLSASATELRKRFNADREKVRLVMLLSPT